MVADKRQRSGCFGKFAVGGGIRLTENIKTDVNKKERFAPFVAADKGSGTAPLAETRLKDLYKVNLNSKVINC